MQDKTLKLFHEHLSFEQRNIVEENLEFMMRRGIKPYSIGSGEFYWKFEDLNGQQITLNNTQYRYYLHLSNKIIVEKIHSIKHSLHGE